MTWEIVKPGSVRRSAAIIYLAPQLPTASSEQPEHTRPRAASHLIASQAPNQDGVLFVLAPGGVYLATQVTLRSGGLLPHRFTLTKQLPSGLLSVALSLALRPVDVIDHLALWSPDFPLGIAAQRLH